jgi:two-component system phosphate regulon sensor histidine kinase PhoR
MKKNILVIDDEYGIRSGIRQILELDGYLVEEAKTGQEALTAVKQIRFDLILIDYRLPDIDGLTLLRAIRSQDPNAMTCMMTAYANIETAIAATKEGIDFFLPKPFSPDDLTGVIETLMRHRMIREEATQLKLAHEASLFELATEKSQTRSLVESLRDAVLVINRNGEVVLVNRAMLSLLKSEESNLLRQPAVNVLGNPAFAPVREALAVPYSGRTVFDTEIGDRRYMVSLSPFHSSKKEVVGHILTVSDISEIHRLTLEKTRFIQTMIHEFRSPLGAIKGMIEVIMDKSLGDNLELYLPLLDRTEKRLDGLVELIGNLLSLAQIESEGRKNISLNPVDINHTLNELTELYRPQAEARSLIYIADVEPGLPGVMTAPEDLKTILMNLIGNAIKYNSENGTVQIRVKRKNNEAQISVMDTGMGIKNENIPRLFNEFFREKRTETQTIVGSGLGLSIVKRLVERSEGRLEVTSTEGTGSTFNVYLPLGPNKIPDSSL